MPLSDLEEDFDGPFEDCCSAGVEKEDEVEYEEEAYDPQDDLTESLVLLEDCRELFLTLLDPTIWEGKYVPKYLRRQVGKLETEILQFTDQWNSPSQEGKEEEK